MKKLEGRSLSDLRGKNIVVWDAEIKNSISKETGITWQDYDKMGISCACLFDYQDGENKVFMDDNINELVDRLNDADLIVGFNIDRFDIPLLSQNAVRAMSSEAKDKTYDLLVEVRRSTGQAFPKGCKLNNVLDATFGMQKTEDGADAPIFWQQGKVGKVITYCLADVRRERMTFEYAYINGFVKTPRHGVHIMENPLERIRDPQ